MSLYDTLKKKLTPEQFTQVTDSLGDDFDYDVVPRARLNKVIAQRNELRKQLAEGSKPQDTPDIDGDDDNDDDTAAGKEATGKSGVDEAALRKQLEAEKVKAVQDVKIQYAALDKLRAAGAIDAELVYNGGLIDRTKLSIDDAGTVTGLDEMIADLQKNKAHLFKQAGSEVPPGTGKSGEEKFEGVKDLNSFLQLSADKQIAFKQANPELFKSFVNAQ